MCGHVGVRKCCGGMKAVVCSVDHDKCIIIQSLFSVLP